MTGFLAAAFAYLFVFPILVCAACIARLKRALFPRNANVKPRLVWAGVAIGSLATTSNAMKAAGYESESIASVVYKNIDLAKFDRVIGPVKRLPFGLNTLFRTLCASLVLIGLMFRKDILHGFFNGGILGKTPLKDWEYFLWKLSGGKLILLPYGSDSFIYSQLPDEPWANAIKVTYPRSDIEDFKIRDRIRAFTAKADCVVGCIVHDCCLPRVDARTVLWYPFDNSLIPHFTDAMPPYRIAHSTNHRKIKGTEALIFAVENLQEAGHPVELEIIENAAHHEVIAAYSRADIVVDQLLFGYAFSALEGMALGKPVITGITDEIIYRPYLSLPQMMNSPIIFSAPDTIRETLEGLLQKPDGLSALGKQTRQYADHYHSDRACSEFFSAIYADFFSFR